MRKRKSWGKLKQTADSCDTLVELLLQMELGLKQLQGNVVTLQALGETTDSVEPIALASLAQNFAASFERTMELWRASLVAARP